MLYILVPEGWFFQSGSNEMQTKDCLVHQINKTQMPLQEIIQDCLREWPRYKDSISKLHPSSGETLAIYRKMPYLKHGTILEYNPKNNGKNPAVDVIAHYRNTVVAPSPQPLINPFHFLHNPNIVLRPEKRQLLQEKAENQKENRRHYGDSPQAT